MRGSLALLGNDGDEDSLFGSPPQSPGRGRSPSPLALPSGSSAAQNVGTLALPGSHHVAELPVTSPAFVSFGAPPVTQGTPPYHPTSPSPQIPSSQARSTSTPTRASRPIPSHRVSKPRKGKEKAGSTPRPDPPPMSLPGPDEPTPPNLLRNQQALLGLAGVVGAINTASLPRSSMRGSSADCPIILDDGPQPSIGKHPLNPRLGLSNLPPPTSEQILSTLLKQKNVLPVIVSLLRLLAPDAPSLSPAPYGPLYPSTTPSEGFRPASELASAPPLKKRKLLKVPAGATDWDVPYPFREGQGPENYRERWEKQRGKQLLADLVQLVQSAAKKAAFKAHTQQSRRQPLPQHKVLNHYRPETLYYGKTSQNSEAPGPSVNPAASSGLNVSSTPRGLYQGNSNGPLGSPPVPGSANPFDQLVGALLAAQHQGRSGSGDVASSSQDISPSISTGDSALFDNWLAMLSNAPPEDPNEIFTGDTSLAEMEILQSEQFPDYLIDPALRDTDRSGLPQVQTNVPTAFTELLSAGTPSLITSPSVTTSDLADPGTPSFDWTFPIDSSDAGAFAHAHRQEKPAGQLDVDPSFIEFPFDLCTTDVEQLSIDMPDADTSMTPTTSDLAQFAPLDHLETPMEVDTPAFMQPIDDTFGLTGQPEASSATLSQSAPSVSPSLVIAPADVVQAPQQVIPPPPTARLAPSAPARNSKASAHKHAVLEKARAMRAVLQREAERAKVQLWETTLEHAALVALVKELGQ